MLTAFLFTVLCTSPPLDVLPEKAKAILDQASSIELYSLDPIESEKSPPKDGGLHGWKVLGKTTAEGNLKQEMLTAVTTAIGQKATGARCFWPRHAIRAVHEGKTVDLVICYECSWVYVFFDKDQKPTILTTSSAQEALDKVLRAAKVPLPAPAKKQD